VASLTPNDAWNPSQYDRFKAERRQPFDDLVTLIAPRASMDIIDLGSGTGELTRELHDRFGARSTVGLERSAAMRETGAAFATGGLRFEAGCIEDFAPESAFDLVFSNAALHWVEGHPALFARLRQALKPQGQLAVQMPANFGHASHETAAEVAREAPFQDALGGFVRKAPVLAVEEYAALLHTLGFRHQHVRLQVYGHSLARGSDVVEWTRGSLLTSYQERLPPDLYDRFLARYRETLAERIDPDAPFFFTFKRILMWAAL
jgi:trans-aconitate 2-methyltransferase